MSNKIWVFGFRSVLNSEELDSISESLNTFLQSWNAHGALISSSFGFFKNQFLYISVYKESEEPSGCSIDSLFLKVSEIAKLFSLELFSEDEIIFFNGDFFISISREDFKVKVSEGSVSSETLVADLSIREVSSNDNLDDLVIKPAKNSWHKTAFKL